MTSKLPASQLRRQRREETSAGQQPVGHPAGDAEVEQTRQPGRQHLLLRVLGTAVDEGATPVLDDEIGSVKFGPLKAGVDGVDADALGKVPEQSPAEKASKPETREDLEKQVWDQMKTCYDPEIPVNVVDLGLIYDCHIEELEPGSHKASVKMTLTAPGCGMGPVIQADVENKILCVETVDEADVELVWEPLWGREMMSEAARLELGMV